MTLKPISLGNSLSDRLSDQIPAKPDDDCAAVAAANASQKISRAIGPH
jgi:hypothetical protein